MLPVTTEDLDLTPPDGAFWKALRTLAIGALAVCAVALIAAFLVATPVHAQPAHQDSPGTTDRI